MNPDAEDWLNFATKFSALRRPSTEVTHFATVTARSNTPSRLRVGAAIGGFEAEGGYNGAGQPANNWCWWEVEGRTPHRRAAGGFWEYWEAHVAGAAAAGCRAARVSIEWARCEPLDGRPDDQAIADYCRVLDACHESGLQPVVTLHRFAHPAWMGVDFWLRPDSPERFRQWVELAVDRFAGRTHQWVTVDQLNACAVWPYLAGRHPPGRRLDVAATIRSLDHLLAAHVLAYEVIKERQPQAHVATGNRSLPVYELDRLLVDVLLARRAGVGRHDLRPWLEERRSEHHGAAEPSAGALTWVLRHWAQSAIPLAQALARAVAAVYDSPCDRPIDTLVVAGDGGDVRSVLPARLAGPHRPRRGQAFPLRPLDVLPELPVSVVNDVPAGVDRLRADLDRVTAAAAGGLPVSSYFCRMTGLGTPEAVAGYRDVLSHVVEGNGTPPVRST